MHLWNFLQRTVKAMWYRGHAAQYIWVKFVHKNNLSCLSGWASVVLWSFSIKGSLRYDIIESSVKIKLSEYRLAAVAVD